MFCRYVLSISRQLMTSLHCVPDHWGYAGAKKVWQICILSPRSFVPWAD